MYILKPSEVSELWEAEDPNKYAQRLIYLHIEDVSEQSGEDWRTWDEFEERFEADELKWIADFLVRNLVFVRSDLRIEDVVATCHIMQVLWKTLDLLNNE